MTHLLSSSRITAETSRPSSAALSFAAVQSSSSMRMLRNFVPLGIGSLVSELVDADKQVVGYGTSSAVGGGLEGRVGGGAGCGAAGLQLGKWRGVGVRLKPFESAGGGGDEVLCAGHTLSVPTRVPTRQEVNA